MGITDTAIERLRALILSGDLSPGDRLPPEPQLALQLGISRGSVREAVRALTHARMLDVRRGDGTYVTNLEPHQLLEGIGYAAQLARENTVLDVVEVRRLLEPPAARLASERISDAELAELAEVIAAMDDAVDPDLFVSLDAQFHNRIAEATGNEWLAAILRGLAEPTIRARRDRLVVDPDAVPALTQRQHRDLYDALRLHDGHLAEAVALTHVCTTQRGLTAVPNVI